jgi:hypothetical protein
MNTQGSLNELLVSGVVGFVYLEELIQAVESTNNLMSEPETRQTCLAVLGEVIRQGLMDVGSVEESFKVWSLTEHEVLEKVEREWLHRGRTPDLWYFCFLNNTAKGNALAAEILDRLQRCVDELVVRCGSGLVDAATAVEIAREVGDVKCPDELEWYAAKTICYSAWWDLAEVGDVVAGQFVPRSVLIVEDAIDRVMREFYSLGRLPQRGEVCWLRLTPKGMKRAEEIARQREGGAKPE